MEATLAMQTTELKTPENTMPHHVVVYSSGRSGSNRMLDILDQHENTNCRNEPDGDDLEVRNLLFDTQRSGLPEDFLEQWAGVVVKCGLHKGRRDRYEFLKHKEYLLPIAGRVWSEAVRRRKVRRFLLGLGNRTEWPIPRVVLRNDAAASIIPVLKLSGTPAWFVGPHFDQPNQWIIHNIRDPKEYLNSWYNRFVAKSGLSDEEMYDRVLAATSWKRREAGLAPSPGPFSFRNLLIAELWGWLFMNEKPFKALQNSPRYMAVSYKDVSADEISMANRIFEFLGLEFGSSARARLESVEQRLFTRPHETKLDDTLVDEVIEEVSGDSLVLKFLF